MGREQDPAGRRTDALAALCLLGIALAGCGGSAEPALELRSLAADVQYTGQGACRQCHLEKFSTFVRTGMGRSLYPLTPAEVVEDFTTDNEFVAEPSGIHYRMVERDGRFYQQQFVVDSQGNELASNEHELVYVIGSNHHSRSYVILQDNKLFQAPVCWYPQESRWELCPGYEHKNEHFERELGSDCLMCHNGVMRPVPGERNEFETPFPHGIDCERCHGPGQLHVARWQQGGETPRGEADATIVNPRRLPQEERIEVCFQCHLGDAKATELVRRHGPQRSFRPGMKLTDVVLPYHYREQTQHDFGLSAQADRLILSRCYRESGGRIECLTCHNPHVTIYHPDRPDDYFRLKCLTCHAEPDCTAAAAERAATRPAPDDCVACHMRKAEPDDQRFTVFTDHWIRRDARVERRDHRQSYELEPVFPERVAALPVGEQAFYAGRAASLLARDAPESRRQEMWITAEREFERAIASGFDNVESWFFLGKTRHEMGKRGAAREALEQAVMRDPTHHDAVYALGQALVAKGDHARALELFRGMLERDPDDPLALAESGRALATLGRIPEAIAAYEHALREEPWIASTRLNLGMLLASQGRFDEAVAHGEAAVRLDPDDPGNWEFYVKIMTAAGRADAAREGGIVLARLRR